MASGLQNPDGSERVSLTDGGGNSIAMLGERASATGTVTTVASSASNVTILAANTSRIHATVFNASTAILYLNVSATAATTAIYTVQIAPNGYYEVPNDYQGQLSGIWASANGQANVTEMT
jgi:hypothetical protein